MEIEQINRIEELKLEHNKLIDELKELKIKLEEAEEKYKKAELEYSELEKELDSLDDDYFTIERIENNKKKFIEVNNSNILKKIMLLCGLLLPIITALIGLITIKSIPAFIITIISSCLIGTLIGFLIHKGYEKKYLKEFQIKFESTDEYKVCKKQLEENQQLKNKKTYETFKKSEVCQTFKKEYNDLYNQINTKINQIDDFKNIATSIIFADDLDKLKEEIHPGKYVIYNKKVLSKKKIQSF